MQNNHSEITDQTTLNKALYSDYIQFKNWSFGELTEDLRESYFDETAFCKLSKDTKVFELGFGQGSFLRWCREQGYESYGTEINSELVALAKKSGYQVCHSSEDIFELLKNRKMDLIVAFDVLEHFTQTEIINFFILAKQVLSEKGRILIRVPNGQSPFGRYYQYGDPTHVSVLSRVIVEQLALQAGFGVELTKNSARPLGKSFIKKVKRFFIYKLRDWIGSFIALVFWGEIYPMDPNITMVLATKPQLKE